MALKIHKLYLKTAEAAVSVKWFKSGCTGWPKPGAMEAGLVKKEGEINTCSCLLWAECFEDGKGGVSVFFFFLFFHPPRIGNS